MQQNSRQTVSYAFCVFRPSFTARIIKAAVDSNVRELDRAADGIIGTALKIPNSLSDLWRIIPLKTLLDAYGRGNNIGAGNEPDMVDRDLTLKRKKRRGLRL